MSGKLFRRERLYLKLHLVTRRKVIHYEQIPTISSLSIDMTGDKYRCYK